jgi:hypothetical protein
VCGGLFHFSVSDFCNKSMNNIYDDINKSDASIWHSHLCHLNFGSMSRLSSLNLIPNLSIVKGSKCQSCVQSKQPRKSHKAAKDRHLAPIELLHSDICEMNNVLTEGGQRYFMTMIVDTSRYYYVYLLKTKDNALNCFKTYKAEVENQLEKRSNILGPIVVVNISLMSLTYSVRNMVLYTRRHHPIHPNQTGLPKESHID